MANSIGNTWESRKRGSSRAVQLVITKTRPLTERETDLLHAVERLVRPYLDGEETD